MCNAHCLWKFLLENVKTHWFDGEAYILIPCVDLIDTINRDKNQENREYRECVRISPPPFKVAEKCVIYESYNSAGSLEHCVTQYICSLTHQIFCAKTGFVQSGFGKNSCGRGCWVYLPKRFINKF